MICPRCHAEYRPEVTSCPDCDVALIPGISTAEEPDSAASDIPEWMHLSDSLDQPDLLAVTSVLEAAGIPFQVQGEFGSGNFGLPTTVLVPADRLAEAQTLVSTSAQMSQADIADAERLSTEPEEAE